MSKKIAMKFSWDELMLISAGLQDRIQCFAPASRMSLEMSTYVFDMEALKERITSEANTLIDEES